MTVWRGCCQPRACDCNWVITTCYGPLLVKTAEQCHENINPDTNENKRSKLRTNQRQVVVNIHLSESSASFRRRNMFFPTSFQRRSSSLQTCPCSEWKTKQDITVVSNQMEQSSRGQPFTRHKRTDAVSCLKKTIELYTVKIKPVAETPYRIIGASVHTCTMSMLAVWSRFENVATDRTPDEYQDVSTKCGHHKLSVWT